MRRALVLALAVPALFVLAGQPTASADHMLFGRYYWVRPSSSELKLNVYLNDVYWKSSFTDAMNEWASRTEFTFGTASSSNCNIPTGYAQVKICDADYGNTGWGAVAEVRVDGSNHIQGGRVRLNTYYRWSYSSARSAWCQEFGHILGLDHRGTSGTTADDPDSCMSYHPTEPEHPDAHDISQLACQTVTSSEPKPNANCNSSSGGGSSCILGIICFNKQEAAHAEKHQVQKQSDGTVLFRFSIAPPRSVIRLPHQALW